jgi:GntR family transcriptional regulator, transcriptional repressor for pyruvate dehydrogenase complex
MPGGHVATVCQDSMPAGQLDELLRAIGLDNAAAQRARHLLAVAAHPSADSVLGNAIAAKIACMAQEAPPARRFRHVRVADIVAADLRNKIMSGYFATTEFPTQHEIADQTGAGLTSVREAMRILESEGLITIRRGNKGGAEVHSPGVDSSVFSLGLTLQGAGTTVGALGAALRDFEPVCARLCAASSDAEEIAGHLRSLNDQSAELLEDESRFGRLSREFHSSVVAMCGNKAISLVLRSMVGLWTLQEERALATRPEPDDQGLEWRRRVLEAHRLMTKLIANGDSGAAEDASRTHLAEAQRYVLRDHEASLVDVTHTARGSV